MASYHIHPRTGEVSRCRAIFRGCPFGGSDEHFDTSEQAREAFEHAQKAHSMKALQGAKVSQSFSVEAVAEYQKLFLSSSIDKFLTDEESYRDGRHARYLLASDTEYAPFMKALLTYKNEEQSAVINGILNADAATIAQVKQNGLSKDYVTYITQLDEFVKRYAEAAPAAVYKGATIASQLEERMLLERLSGLTPGERITFRGFTSTSVSYETAEAFMQNGPGLIYEVAGAHGVYINDRAEEILIGRATRFRFLDYTPGDGTIPTTVRLIQEAGL